jgi:hypothetical protein
MRVFVFAPFFHAPSHQDFLLEITAHHLNCKDEVHVITCERDLSLCESNRTHSWKSCFTCKSMGKQALSLIGVPKERVHRIQVPKSSTKSELPKFKNIQELKAFEWRGIPLGTAVAASIISAFTRESQPDTVMLAGEIEKLIKMYMAIYDYVDQVCQEYKPDKFYLFNGRVSSYNAVLQAARKHNIPCLVGERNLKNEYVIIENSHSLDLEFYKREIKQIFDKRTSDEEALQVGSAWFEEQRRGELDLHYNFVIEQNKGFLPKNFDSKKINIAVFPSSEDEMAVDPMWANPFFQTQLEAIQFILSRVQDEKFHFYYRGHPNLKTEQNSQVKSLRKLKANNLTVFFPQEHVDSYALMEGCDRTLCFGSTIGIEATYWGKPSILAGHAYYEGLNACHVPRTKDELISLLTEPLSAIPKERALPYGYWLKKRGTQFKYIQPSQPRTGETSKLGGKRLVWPEQYVVELLKWGNRLGRVFSRLRWSS